MSVESRFRPVDVSANVGCTSRCLTVSFHDVTISLPLPSSASSPLSSRKIINNISGSIKGGSLTAILGGSGAGKTTFLHYLACRVSSQLISSGSVRVNDQPISPSFVASCTSFVEQHTVLLPSLTPRETVAFAGRMRLPQVTTHADHDKNVRRILQSLDLTKCADHCIGDELLGGISGGEKRRVSVAVELVTKPTILFADGHLFYSIHSNRHFHSSHSNPPSAPSSDFACNVLLFGLSFL